jgi:hypothetical protein
MKKTLVWLLAVCFMGMGASLALADTRTDSLGLSAGQQIDDLDSIWLFPQDAANFGNVVDYRLGLVGAGSTLADSWGGVISKEWDSVGYIGVYADRPFDMSNVNGAAGPRPSENLANQFGILNGAFGSAAAGAGAAWTNALNPTTAAAQGGAQIGTAIADHGGNITATYTALALPVAVVAPQNKLDAFWARQDGDTSFGLHINYASQDAGNIANSETYVAVAAGNPVATSNNGFSQVLGADIGLGLKNALFDNLDLAVGYSLGSVNYFADYNLENTAVSGTDETTNTTEKDHNISEIRVNALGTSKITDNVNGRLYANLRIDNLGIDSNTNNESDAGVNNAAGDVIAQTNTYSDTNINVGYACNHKVADGKATVIAGLEFIYDQRQWGNTDAENAAGSTSPTQLLADSGETETETTIVIPLNVAVEAPLFSWLKARFGAYKNLYQNVTDKIVEPTNLNGAGTAFQTQNVGQDTVDAVNNINMFAGVGAEFQNFTLDLQVSEVGLQTYMGSFQPGAGIFYSAGPAIFTQGDLRYAF